MLIARSVEKLIIKLIWSKIQHVDQQLINFSDPGIQHIDQSGGGSGQGVRGREG